MRIIGVNGIHNDPESKDSFTDRFLRILGKDRGVFDVQYPKMLAVLGWSQLAVDLRARIVAKCIQPGDVVLAHSFGALATIRAVRDFGARPSKVIMFGAAANDDVELPAWCEFYNIFSRTDTALLAASLLPVHPFGSMGKFGHLGQENLVQIDATGFDHNDYAAPENIEAWCRVIEAIIDGTFSATTHIPNNNAAARIAYNAGVDSKFGRG